MKIRYTPGIWRAEQSAMGDFYVVSDNDCITICVCEGLNQFNAYLIAAAPKMFETLLQARDAKIWDLDNPEELAALNAINGVLAQALGESAQ